MIAAVVVLVASEGPIGLTLLGVGLLGTVAVLVGGFWFIAKRGVLRWVGLALAVALVVVIFFRAGVVAVALVSLLLLVLGGAAARHALRHTAEPWVPTSAPVPALHSFIVMTPRSGGGKVVRFDLAGTARALGAGVVLLEGPGTSMWPRWSGMPSTGEPICWASPAVTVPGRWSPGSPPTTTSRCW